MEQPNIVSEYERRLNSIPQIDPLLKKQVTQLQSIVSDQNEQISLQQIKIKALQSEMIKLDKNLQIRQNQLQQLNNSEQKTIAKQKKYFLQIQNYNKKIEKNKIQIANDQKKIIILKKDNKILQNNIANLNIINNKLLQNINKQQIKINTMNQNLNDLKLNIMQQQNSTRIQSNLDLDTKKYEKQIQQLFTTIKKQIALIDILKRQKVHVIASTIFKYCQEQFQQLLEINKSK